MTLFLVNVYLVNAATVADFGFPSQWTMGVAGGGGGGGRGGGDEGGGGGGTTIDLQTSRRPL